MNSKEFAKAIGVDTDKLDKSFAKGNEAFDLVKGYCLEIAPLVAKISEETSSGDIGEMIALREELLTNQAVWINVGSSLEALMGAKGMIEKEIGGIDGRIISDLFAGSVIKKIIENGDKFINLSK